MINHLRFVAGLALGETLFAISAYLLQLEIKPLINVTLFSSLTLLVIYIIASKRHHDILSMSQILDKFCYFFKKISWAFLIAAAIFAYKYLTYHGGDRSALVAFYLNFIIFMLILGWTIAITNIKLNGDIPER